MMAREVQSQSGRSGASLKAFGSLLGNAIFWVVVAIVLPVRDIAAAVPELAPYAPWVPVVCYALAFWSFVRALRMLQRLAAGKAAAIARPRSAATTPQARRAANAKPAGTQTGLPVTRTPTVQRMR